MIICIIILIIAIILTISSFGKNKNNQNNFIGSWTNDGITVYKFNKDNTGELIVSLTEYEFTYKIEDKTLYIDFENEKSTDSQYSYSFEKDKLILKGDNGTFTFTKKN